MELIYNLGLGFATALTPANLLYCFIGAFLGTIIGILPGVGPITTIALLLPISFSLDPTASLIMLAGIYYGASYGGSTTAILMNLPGEASSAVTAIDGYENIVKLLLDKGAYPNIQNADGKTPLDFAKAKKKTDVIALLELSIELEIIKDFNKTRRRLLTTDSFIIVEMSKSSNLPCVYFFYKKEHVYKNFEK